jgi:hypothetical protein
VVCGGVCVQVATPYLEGSRQSPNPSPPPAGRRGPGGGHPVSALDFSMIGSDVIRLEEGLRRLQLDQTMSAIDRLEGVYAGEGSDEIDFGRLAHLMKQVGKEGP